jgi:dipeptidyl aminopeptidase/acylaminoacyl peptidase
MRTRSLLSLVCSLLLALPAIGATSLPAAPVSTPAPQDVPVPVAGEVTTAGSARPDISRFLNVRNVSRPTLAPDGRRLSFVTNTTGQPQLWTSNTHGGAPMQLTFLETSVTFQAWSPAGEWIVYGTDRGGNEREGYYLISPDGLRERELIAPGEAFRVFGGWSHDGRRIAFASTERNGTDFDIYVMDVPTDMQAPLTAARRVHQGTGGLYVVSWRPDGKALLLSKVRGEADNDIYQLDLASGRLDAIFRPEDGASYVSFAWTPDSKGFYVVTNQDRDLAALAHYELATRTLRWVETPTVDIEAVTLSNDGRWLAWTLNENGYSGLRIRDTRNGRTNGAPASLPHGVYAIELAPRASVLAVRVAGPQIAGDVWTLGLDRENAVAARATQSATGGLDPTRFVVPEAVSFASWDGETIYGLLYTPAAGSAGAAPPVLVGVHGGPTSQARPVYNSAFQYLLTRGIAVLDLNFRGSTGYGKRFTRLDNQRLRPNAVKDMAGALDWLASTKRVDVSRAAVMGGSYGGYMTFAALTQLPERFRAGVSLVGVSNWLTALEGASPELKASDKIEYGNIDDPEDRRFFVQLSPITHVANVRAPLMVLHGANDPRDPVQEADQLVAAIRSRGGDVEYLRFPDEGHVIRKQSNRVIAYRRIAAFLERTLEPQKLSVR